ncbi:MAG: hypothetical protein K6E98_05425 [Lachnospiraceae bacterium]|nr:hypothetical protein [Lachnospiraceae bacterium]
MDNLFDRARKTKENVLAKQIAEMKTYRISVYCSILLYNIYFYILLFLGKFIRKIKIQSNKLTKKSFSSQLMLTETRLNREGFLINELMDISRYYIRLGHPVLISGNRSEDDISAKMTRSASGILQKSEIEGKSVYEINDLVYKRYPDRKKHLPIYYLRIWLGLSCFLLLACFVLSKYDYLPTILVILLFTIFESGLYLFMSRIISKWHLAKLVWLIISETGSYETAKSDRSISEDIENYEMVALRMRTLHTLIYSANVLSNEENKLKNSIADYNKQLERNSKIINSYGIDTSAEEKRIITGKKDENKRIKGMIRETKEQIAKKSDEYSKANSLIMLLIEDIVPVFSGKWKKDYDRLRIKSEVQRQIVCFYSLNDIKTIEQRFFEINNTSDPTAIAKKKNGLNMIPFLTSSERSAYLGFSDPDSEGYINITLVEREDKLVEPFVTQSEMNEAMKGITTENTDKVQEYEDIINRLHKYYEDESLKWTSEKTELEQANIKLEEEKAQLGKEIIDIQKNIDTLADELNQKKEECKKLQILIVQFKKAGNDEKVRQLTAALAKYQQQAELLQKEYDDAIAEIENLFIKLDNLNEEKEQLISKLNEKESMLSEADNKIRLLDDQIGKKNEEISGLNDTVAKNENQIVSLNGLLKAAEKASMKDKKKIEQLESNKQINEETIRKIQNNKKELERENHILNEKITDNTKKISDLRITKDNLIKLTNSQKSEIDNLKNKIKNSKRNILYDAQIYEELYRWIRGAQEYVYIISPFLSKDQVERVNKKFRDAVSSNPDLKIRILYGIKDKNSKGQITNEDAIIRARSLIGKLKMGLEGHMDEPREINTHIKLVLVDDRKYMIGSANVLSFGGIYNKKGDTRGEIAICSENKEEIMELKNKFFNW